MLGGGENHNTFIVRKTEITCARKVLSLSFREQRLLVTVKVFKVKIDVIWFKCLL